MFNYVIDWVLGKALEDHPGVQVNHTTDISDLDYADDVAMLAYDEEEMQRMLERVSSVVQSIGLVISIPKTKVLTSPQPYLVV